MKFIVDENVSFTVVEKLRILGHSVIAIAEEYTSLKDPNVYKMVLEEKAILITRDYHFTNSLRYPPEKTEGIVYIRHGNLKSEDELSLVVKFLEGHDFSEIKGSLVTLCREGLRIRPPRNIF